MNHWRVRRLLWCSALLVLLGGCGILAPDDVDTLTLYVGPTTVDCVGVGPQRCLLVREKPEEEWRYFYGGILGFTHEPGYSYVLRVERRRVANPPADGSSLEYRLRRILSRAAAPAG